MYINRISGAMNTPVAFRGHYRSLEVKGKDSFQARVAGSEEDSGVCQTREEAIYRAIRNSKDYMPYNKIEKLDKKEPAKKPDVLEVYYTDRNEKVNVRAVEPYADYIVFASGSGISIYP